VRVLVEAPPGLSAVHRSGHRVRIYGTSAEARPRPAGPTGST